MPVGEEERELYARVAVLGEVVRGLQGSLAELARELDGPPWERSVKGRIEAIEAEGASARAASRALAEAQQEHRKARAEREQAASFRWSWRWKALAAITAAFLAAAPYVTMFYGPGS